MDQGSGFGTTVFKFPHDFPINRASENKKQKNSYRLYFLVHEPKNLQTSKKIF